MTERVFKRKIYDRILEWKVWSKGRYALLIEGARRIGKSTIVEEFARNEYEDYILIDFSNVSKDVLNLFDDMSDLNRFFLRLQTFFGKTLPVKKSVIIFDEVQFCPKARQSIKYLVKDGRFNYIETGSLISIKKNVKDILIPSEEHAINMFPMDFEEFLWAIGQKAKFDFIRYSYENMEPMGDAMNRKLMEDFRLYMLVGGMPQSVIAYLDNPSDFSEVDRIKREILHLYEADFRKLDSTGRAATIFNHIPAELSRNTMRYKVGSVIEGARPERLGELFADIVDSRTVNMAYLASDPSAGLAMHANHDYFKMFTCDTGLFVTLAFHDKDFTDNIIYRKLLFDKLPTDLGYVYENVVAQLLASAGHSLYYHAFTERQEGVTKQRTYEIDFLINQGDKICPIEVKSSSYKSHKSLDEFTKKYSSRIGKRYLLYTKDIRKDSDIICLPVYMTGLL